MIHQRLLCSLMLNGNHLANIQGRIFHRVAVNHFTIQTDQTAGQQGRSADKGIRFDTRHSIFILRNPPRKTIGNFNLILCQYCNSKNPRLFH